MTRPTALVLAITAALIVTAASPRSAEAEQIGKYRNNGAYAYANGFDATGCRYFHFSVSRSGTTAAPQTYLYYDVYDQCSGAWSWGSGTIPNTAFKTGNKSNSLNFAGTASGGFSTGGESLAIAVTFTKNSMVTYTWSGHHRWEYFGHVVQHHGSASENSATVSGTIGGISLQAHPATTGTGRDRYVEFDRGKK